MIFMVFFSDIILTVLVSVSLNENPARYDPYSDTNLTNILIHVHGTFKDLLLRINVFMCVRISNHNEKVSRILRQK